MRLWSLHPKFLDIKGLGATWNEGIIGLNALIKNGGSWFNHSQLLRFKAKDNPVKFLSLYLVGIYSESRGRGCNYNKNLIPNYNEIEKMYTRSSIYMSVTEGQLKYEWDFLQYKFKTRKLLILSPYLQSIPSFMWENIEPLQHPIFCSVKGGIEKWEKVKDIK